MLECIMHHLLPYSDSCLYWCLAYILEGISDLRIYVAVTSPYPPDRGVTLFTVGRPPGRPQQGSVDRPVDQERAQCAHPQLPELWSTERSTVLACNRHGRPPGRSTLVKTENQPKIHFENMLCFEKIFVRFLKYRKLSILIIKQSIFYKGLIIKS